MQYKGSRSRASNLGDATPRHRRLQRVLWPKCVHTPKLPSSGALAPAPQVQPLASRGRKTQSSTLARGPDRGRVHGPIPAAIAPADQVRRFSRVPPAFTRSRTRCSQPMQPAASTRCSHHTHSVSPFRACHGQVVGRRPRTATRAGCRPGLGRGPRTATRTHGRGKVHRAAPCQRFDRLARCARPA